MGPRKITFNKGTGKLMLGYVLQIKIKATCNCILVMLPLGMAVDGRVSKFLFVAETG